MLLRIGQAGLRGELKRYRQHFDLLELCADRGRMPRLARLKAFAELVEEPFVFSVMLPHSVTSVEPGPEAEGELAHALKAADVLGAHWLVVQSPAAATPGARTRRRLAGLRERLGTARWIAWEPGGLWEEAESERFARELGWHVVRDLTRAPAPDDPVVYTRLRALGESARVRASGVERLAERLDGCSSAYVVIEGRGAAGAARLLRDLVGVEGTESEDSVLSAEGPRGRS